MLKTILKSTAIAASAIALPAIAAAEPIKLRVTNGLSPTHVVTVHGIDAWMTCMTDRTGGEVTFDNFPGGQISTVRDTTDGMSAGLADVGFISTPNEVSKLPLNAIAMLPGGGDSAVEVVEAYRASVEAGSPLAQEIDSLGLVPFIFSSLAPYQIMARSKTIDSLEDFQGVKVRVTGGPMNFTAMSLGAVPTEMPAGDLYIALERGTVDATILSMASVKTYSLQELVTAMSSNGTLGTSTQFFAFGKAAWDRLSAEQQEAALSCGREVETALAEFIDAEDDDLAAEFASLGITVFEFSPEELEKINTALESATQQYVDRIEERGLPAQEVLESLRGQPAG